MATTKGLRLDEELRSRFERYCREHLLDERAVVEAWLLRFLEAVDQERQSTAKRYAEWMAARKDPAIQGAALAAPAKRHRGQRV